MICLSVKKEEGAGAFRSFCSRRWWRQHPQRNSWISWNIFHPSACTSPGRWHLYLGRCSVAGIQHCLHCFGVLCDFWVLGVWRLIFSNTWHYFHPNDSEEAAVALSDILMWNKQPAAHCLALISQSCLYPILPSSLSFLLLLWFVYSAPLQLFIAVKGRLFSRSNLLYSQSQILWDTNTLSPDLQW